ncbi:indolepyruvate ferredoxin oxidoreductase subunit alpha [Bacilliculturomica massiliensis]|uniref:indolepyruvate ferredoxin oxidoreductase subunit alpha n=1 Tax=Bacilliculturomica massiliensis TaxID=1917867 RepID=UPI001FE60D89|nr:4Fe-4S binding protein [Bacilliculturomica massiliensis]
MFYTIAEQRMIRGQYQSHRTKEERPMTVFIDKNKCISCGACAVVCPARAITLRGGCAHVDPTLCTGCGMCVCKCYTRAIHKGEPEAGEPGEAGPEPEAGELSEAGPDLKASELNEAGPDLKASELNEAGPESSGGQAV